MPSAFRSLRPTAGDSSERKKAKKRRRKQQNSEISKTACPPSLRAELEEEEEEEPELGFYLKSSASSNSHAIQPLGNLLLAPSAVNIRNPGLGSLAVLPDDLVLDLLALLSAKSLTILSAVSKSLFVFSTHEPLWRTLVLDESNGEFLFAGSWRSTYISFVSVLNSIPKPLSIAISNFYSDYLFQSWLCANMEMKPEWLAVDNIERRRGISVEEFVTEYEELNKPVLLEGCIESWPAMKKWSPEWLVSACGDTRFAVGPVQMTMENYFRYSCVAREERPLYLFDPRFADKVFELGSDYEVPEYFEEDLFGLLGNERPDYRWIVIGPAGSGSSFHVDPNSTSAWNAVVMGSKKWVMFPPEVVPPGVHPSPDGAEVACPVSIMEWFMNFYMACGRWKKKPVECICRAGEVVFVPNGWWHLVVNLEDSIAITQNYVSRRNLLNVLDFLKKPNANELVSGTKDRSSLHGKFRNAMEANFPGTMEALTLKAQEEKAKVKKMTFWESASDANVGGFKFSF